MFLFNGCWHAVSTVLVDVGEARGSPQLRAPIPQSKGLNMPSTRRLRTAAPVALSVFPFASLAANDPMFMNDRSICGQPAT